MIKKYNLLIETNHNREFHKSNKGSLIFFTWDFIELSGYLNM